MISIEDLTNFILKYRHGKAFEGWTEEQIHRGLLNAFQNGTICVTFADGKDDAEHITSICHWMEFPFRKTIYILNVLSNGSKGILPALMSLMKEKYGVEWFLEGMRYAQKKNFGIQQKFAMRVKHSIKGGS